MGFGVAVAQRVQALHERDVHALRTRDDGVECDALVFPSSRRAGELAGDVAPFETECAAGVDPPSWCKRLSAAASA
ncbi:MAG: hypothetical protein U1E63_11300 [Burkholderiales bacterium]